MYCGLPQCVSSHPQQTQKDVCWGSGTCPSLDSSLASVGLAHMQVSAAGRAQDSSIKMCDCKGPKSFYYLLRINAYITAYNVLSVSYTHLTLPTIYSV